MSSKPMPQDEALMAQEATMFVEMMRRAQEMPCIVCGRTPGGNGCVWQPNTEESRRAVGAPLGRHRHVFYGLCSTCIDKPGIFEEVERLIIDQCAVRS